MTYTFFDNKFIKQPEIYIKVSTDLCKMMKRDKYRKITVALDKSREDDCVKDIMEKFPDVDKNTIGSIYALELQRKVRKNYHRVCNADNPDTVAQLYYKFETAIENKAANGIILRMAKEIDFSPAMLAKVLLEYYVSQHSHQHIAKSQLNQMLREPSLISNKDLAYEISLCQLKDCAYGPYADSIKHSIGQEYEFYLKEKLKELDISYQDENDLRTRGFDKTPDVKLEIPIAVGGKVINWIESKASFGDDETHKKNLKDQFWSYWNRFGAGLVIYWFGYIEELDKHSDKGIILRDSFPTDIIQMEVT